VTAGINDSGEVVGTSGNCTLGPIEAVLWRNGTPINLGTLGGAVFNIAFGINNRGQVVGQSNLPGDTTHHAFRWQDGVMTDLGTLPGIPGSLAPSINNKGQVVGFSDDFNGNTVALLWQDGTMTDLNTLIPADSPWFLLEALGINDRGQIAGYGLLTAKGEVHAFVATPCGEEEHDHSECETSQRPNVVLPENVRKLLQQRLGSRYHIGGLGTPEN
jgi:probable HAF family extracellular repeat protein